MSEFVRVRLPNGHEATLSAAYVAGTDLQVLDVPATNLRGRPLPASRRDGRRMKPKTSVEKEVVKKAAKHQSASPASSDTPTTGGVAVTPEEATE